MLQMFPLDVVNIDMVLHMLRWDPSTAAGPACIRVGVEGVREGYHASADRDEAARDMERRVAPREAT